MEDRQESVDWPQKDPNTPPWQSLGPHKGRSQPFLAWLGVLIAWVIIVGVLVLKGSSEFSPEQATAQEAEVAEPAPVSPKLVLDIRSRVVTELQGRYLVGAANLVPGFKPQALEQASLGLERGSLGERLGYVTVIGAVASAKEAEDALSALKEEMHRDGYVPTPEEADVIKTLEQVYGSTATAITQQQQKVLIEQIGWFGSLALAKSPTALVSAEQRDKTFKRAKRTIYIATSAGMLAMGGGVLGVIGLVLVIIFLCKGQIRTGMSIESRRTPIEGISVETFSLWLVFFFFLQWIAGVIGKAVEASVVGALLLAAAAFAVSLIVLICWPLLRGIGWSTMCHQSGFRVGRSFWTEVMWGIAGYVMALPLLVVGLVLTIILMSLSQLSSMGTSDGSSFQTVEEPLHPINLLMIGADVWRYLSILLVGSVCAPIVEEFAFRGMFYRHLRGSTRRWNILLSIAVSALVSAFVFAAIHPQGWVTIPLLMALAVAFALLREWRGSLVAPIIAHGLSNFIVITFGILLLN